MSAPTLVGDCGMVYDTCKILSHSLMLLVRPGLSAVYRATARDGPKAQARVMATRFHMAILMSRNPSMIICPAKVAVMVAACPAARSPIPQMILDETPSPTVSKAAPASSNPILAHRRGRRETWKTSSHKGHSNTHLLVRSIMPRRYRSCHTM